MRRMQSRFLYTYIYIYTCSAHHDDVTQRCSIRIIHYIVMWTCLRGVWGRGCGAWPLIGLGRNNVFNGPPANGSFPSPFFPHFYGILMYVCKHFRAEYLYLYIYYNRICIRVQYILTHIHIYLYHNHPRPAT